MKQLIQSYKTGELGIFDVPAPTCGKNGIVIKTSASLVSAGTEKMIVDLAKKSLAGKAMARPDLVKQVIDKMKQEGIMNALEKVFTKLDNPIPLGYSCAGRVVHAGENVSGVSAGMRVACGGAGYANHSEINFIPKNLFVKIPDGVDDIDASFVTVGAIALQGVRQAEPSLGEIFAVIGLGLIGQITVQLLKANGCRVLGVDVDPEKLALAEKLGADMTCSADELVEAAKSFSSGYGVDAVIITASTLSNQPIVDAGEITRLRGRVVVVGMVGMDIPRNIYYKKELDVRLSMAYGPGRYDPEYEEKGIDYPYSYVRWTEQRNFEAFLALVNEGKITPKELITHKFDFNDALKAYELFEGKIKEKYLGIVLLYPDKAGIEEDRVIRLSERITPAGDVSVGLIGAGNFAKSVIIPTLKKIDGIQLTGLCTSTGVSAQGAGSKHDFKFITTDSREILANNEINSVVITTRHNTHAKLVCDSLRAGKNVFVEKPLCINALELLEIEKIYYSFSSGQSVPLLMVGFNRRFSPLIRKMKSKVNDKPLSVVYRINAGVIPRESWIQDFETGGGRIIGEVCHFIDTCSYLAGADPVAVYARCVNKDDRSIPDEDNVNIVLTYENGSTASINYFAFGNKQMPKEYIELFAGNISMQMRDFRELTIYSGNKKEQIKSSNQDKGFINEFTAFKEALKTGVPAVSFASICKTTRTTFKILESLRLNQAVSI
ncbi:MAG: bi-domain-containing oxidoreductase [Candidatus Schekmanbacteria bacterium]|nr:bi-domain-containing oxidoreductase [Candidatus Schekmanbacteria bacterium]